MIVYPRSIAENNALKAWVEQRVTEYKAGNFTICVGIEREGKLIAVVAWDNWRGVSVEVTIAADSPRWATRQTITTLMSYPFMQLKCQRITSFVRKGNKRARKLNEGLGFKLEGRMRDAGPNLETVLLYGITRKDFVAKYITPYARKVNGRETPAETTARA